MHTMLDAGHGGKDSGAVGNRGTKEKDVNLKIVKRVGKLLNEQGVRVSYTRETDSYIELGERARLANSKAVDRFVSIHINSYKDINSNGTETYNYITNDTISYDLANKIQLALVKEIQLKDRGVKQAAYKVLKETKMEAVLVEVAFISNLKEEQLLRDETFISRVAQAISTGIVRHIKGEISEDTKNMLTLIEGRCVASRKQMIDYLKKTNTSPKLQCSIEELIDHFIKEGNAEGIRGDIAFCQALKETGHFKFGNIVKPEQNNFSGLGALNGNVEGQAASFATPQLGVRAQIQHLKAYASKQALQGTCIDPRFNLVTRGSAKYVEYLGAADNPSKVGWCYPGENYGKEILKVLEEVLYMENTQEHWGTKEIDKMKAQGLITSDKEPTANVTWAEFATVMNRVMQDKNK